MDEYIWRIVFVLIPSLLALLYGLFFVLPKSKGLYFRLSVLAISCLFMANFSYFCLIITGHSFDSQINVGCLGVIGAYLFFFTQNLCPISKVLYDKKNAGPVHKYLPYAAAALVMLLYGAIEYSWFCTIDLSYHDTWYIINMVLQFGIGAVIIAVTSVVTFRYSILPDDNGGLISHMRPYNIALTCMLVLSVAEKYFRYMDIYTTFDNVAIIAFYIVYSISIMALLPLQERGRARLLTF